MTTAAVRQDYVFTSESVSEGHPDKVCDRISDAVLDAFLTEEPNARVACETFATTNRVVVGGEVGLSSKEATHAMMGRIDGIVRDCVRDIGYEQKKFHWEKIKVHNYLHEQSAHIAQGVDRDGAGDQGIMFGYATLETPEFMPAPIQYAHAILRRLTEARKSGDEPTLGPDAKSQLTLRYANGKPVEVTSIVLSTQHTSRRQTSKIIRKIVEPYIREVLPEGWLTRKTEWHVNPTGTFVAALPRMAAARFPARTRPRLTARPPMPRGIWPRTWLPPVWQSVARCRSAMPSAWPSPCRSTSTPMAPARSRLPGSKRPWPR
jgi:S-adenosylmethionine synthetase